MKLGVWIVAVGLVACQGTPATPYTAKKSALGESCVKTDDCAGDLHCFGGNCQIAATVESPDAISGQDVVAFGDSGSPELDVVSKPDACVPVCDGQSCTDNCGGTCVGDCDDGNPCTQGDVCKLGACISGKPKTCESGSVCVVGQCNPQDGQCKFGNVAAGLLCDDNNACTANDGCVGGVCTGTKISCDDKNSCTDDTCSIKDGCAHTANALACEDGNGCTVGDACKAGTCTSGQTNTCDDGNPCTKDLCDVITGICNNDGSSFEGTTCDADGSDCTKNDACIAGACKAGPKVNCDDGNICTADICEAATGKCTHVSTISGCSDGDPCTANDVCSMGTCAAGPSLACDDANSCTLDACEPATGCVHVSLPDGSTCTDGKTCTIESCQQGTCSSVPLKCGANANCVEPGGCKCNAGFSGDGETCSCPSGYLALDIDGQGTCAPNYPIWGVLPVTPQPGWFTDTGGDTVIDSNLGYTWQRTASATQMSWSDADKYCQGMVLLGQTDWRLPTETERESLIDFQESFVWPMLPGAFKNEGNYEGPNWTASLGPQSTHPTGWWSVGAGDTGLGGPVTVMSARCIRGKTGSSTAIPPKGTKRFQVAATQGAVHDSLTGLTWQQDSSLGGMPVFKDAAAYCQKLPLNGGGWRLPTIVELRSLVEHTAIKPAIDADAFPNTPFDEWFRSGTNVAGSSNQHWGVRFIYGESNSIMDTDNAHVRCVK